MSQPVPNPGYTVIDSSINPLLDFYLGNYVVDAEYYVNELGLLDGVTNTDEQWAIENAYQHALAAAEVAYKYGDDVAYDGGLLHELQNRADRGTSDEADSNKDLWNNDQGIAIADAVKAAGGSFDDIPQAVANALRSGQLIISPSDERVAPETALLNEITPLLYNINQLPSNIVNALKQLQAGFLPTDSVDIWNNLVNIAASLPVATIGMQGINVAGNAQKGSGYDPLIINLGSGGVQLTSLQNGVQFDLQDTGFTQQTAWLANSNEGFLVVDPNNDAITNGSQLLGQNTVLPNGTIASSGFQALDELSDAQTQQSGVLTDSDPLFDELRIYENNGTLLTLQQAGITSINLSAENTDVTDQYGNQQLDIGTFTFANGTTGFMGDYALVHNTQLSTDESTLPVSATVAALPNVPGSGVVPSLQQAIMHDTTGQLQSLVEQFIASTDPTSQSSILDQIMTAWAGAPNSDVQPDEHVTVVENLMGQTFPDLGTTAYSIEGAYQLFKESTWAQLMVQSQLSSLFSLITVSADPDTGITTYDLSGLTQALQTELQSNYSQGVQDLANSYRAIVDLGLDQNSDFSEFYSAFSSNPTLKFAMDTAGKEAYTGGYNSTFNTSFFDTADPDLYMNLAGANGQLVFAGISDVLFFDKGDGQVTLGTFTMSDYIVTPSSLINSTPTSGSFVQRGTFDGTVFATTLRVVP